MGGAQQATALLRSREVFSVRAANLHQFSPEKAQRDPLLVAERPEPDTTMEGKRTQTDFVGVFSQFLRLEVKVRGVALAGENPAADCANCSSLPSSPTPVGSHVNLEPAQVVSDPPFRPFKIAVRVSPARPVFPLHHFSSSKLR